MTLARTLILAGGLGTRSIEYLGGIPKFLAPINGAPLCDLLLDFLQQQDMLPAIVAIANGREAVLDHLKHRQDVYFDLDTVQRGTAGAVRHAMIARYREELEFGRYLLIVNGDTLFQAPLHSILRFFQRSHHSWLTITAGNIPVARLVSSSGLELIRNTTETSLEKLLPVYLSYPIPSNAFVDIGTREGYERAQHWNMN